MLPFKPFQPTRPFLTGYVLSKDHSIIYRLAATYTDPFSRSSQSDQWYGVCDEFGTLLFMPIEYWPHGIPHSIDLEYYPTGVEAGWGKSPEQLAEQATKEAKLAALKAKIRQFQLKHTSPANQPS